MNTNNSDGTIRMLCNDDRDPCWSPGQLYRIFPHSNGSTKSNSITPYTPPASPVYTPVPYAPGGGGTYAGSGDISAGMVLAAVGIVLALIGWGIFQSNQARDAAGGSYPYQTAYPDSAVARVACNVRARPNRRGRRIRSVRQGTAVQILQSGTWDRVRLADGREGYIFARLLTKAGY